MSEVKDEPIKQLLGDEINANPILAAALIQQRFESLPACTPPTRDNTIMTYPMQDYRIDNEMHKGLMLSMSLYAGEFTTGGYSDIGLARNIIFNAALVSKFEWIVCVDTDIGFDGEDLQKLLTLCGPQDYAAQGLYAKKDESGEVVVHGLGFSRFHRCVLEAIREYLPMPFMRDGREMQDFFPTGVTPTKSLLREDTAFWFLASQIGVKARAIADLNIRHYGGRRAYTLTELQKRQEW